MSGFDKEMQDALMADAQKLRDMGVEQDDPIFFDDDWGGAMRSVRTPAFGLRH